MAQPKGAVQPARPVASSSSEEHEGTFAQDRSFSSSQQASEDACEWCLKEFRPALPFAPAAQPGKPPGSQGHSDLRLYSGCVPLVLLTELARTGSEERREFIRLAFGSLCTFLKTRANYPFSLERGGFRRRKVRWRMPLLKVHLQTLQQTRACCQMKLQLQPLKWFKRLERMLA